MTPEQASQLRVAIHRLVRAERDYITFGCDSRASIRRRMAELDKLIREATEQEPVLTTRKERP